MVHRSENTDSTTGRYITMSKVKTKRPNKIIGVLVRIDTDDSTIFDFQEGYRVGNYPKMKI